MSKRDEIFFNKDLLFEKENFSKQNQFYIESIKNIKSISRTNFSRSEIERTLQRKDIDLIITTKDGKRFSISEKRRRKFYEDIFFETIHVFKSCDKIMLGWIHKCEADIICYFFDNCAFEINAGPKLKRIFEEKIYPAAKDDFLDFLLRKEKFEKYDLIIDGKTYTVSFILTDKNKEYYSCGIALKPEDLTALGIKNKRFTIIN